MTFNLQEDAWAALRATADRLPHALLIHGVAGIGKLALAERFAEFLLCEGRAAGTDACGRCEACRWFMAGNHPDLRRLEPEALARQPTADGDDEPRSGARAPKPSLEIKIDQLRELADFLNIGSHRGRLRIALVHPAEDMNVHAANALLKSLEEPAPGAVFLLVSHRPARLLPTIRSRCVALAVPLPEREAALAWLDEQGAPEAARWLAFSGGAPLKALEYGEGEHGNAISRLLQAVSGADRAAIAETITTREELELLADVLQKVAMDTALTRIGGETKYGTTLAKAGAATAHEWLAYARLMGRNRALAKHPLNPKLFASEMLSAMPLKDA